jgi:uncharacterized protein YycO
MKKNSLIILISFFLFSCVNNEKSDSQKKNESENSSKNKDSVVDQPNLSKAENDTNFISGDIIFQTSFSHQSDLVSYITQSPFTHCGILSFQKGKMYVAEASSTVKLTPLKDWIASGKNSKYVVMRFIEHDKYAKKVNMKQAKAVFTKYAGKPYDSQFLWSDDKIYCSELVWKLMKDNLNIEICALKKLKDFDLTAKEVQVELKNRYGNNIPHEEWVVSPADIAASNLLKMIFSNY